MKSMTGFGTGRYKSESVEIEISVKSVNGRFLELRIHSPKEFAEFESDIKSKVKQALQRGSVDVYIHRKYKEKGKHFEVSIQQEMATKVLKAYKSLNKSLKTKASDVELRDLLNHQPEIIKVEERPVIDKTVKSGVAEALDKALKNHQVESKREGAAIKKELLGLYSDLSELVLEMDLLKTEASKKLKNRYLEKLSALGMDVNGLDPQRLAQEVVIQVDKLDVREEVIRLKEHIRACKALIAKKSSHGKKLDFYSQELLREVNTIGSKSQIAKLTTAVVNAKSIIERIREQVQNVE